MKTVEDYLREYGQNINGLTVSPAARTDEISEIFSRNTIGAIVVVENENLIGLITLKDFTYRVLLTHHISKIEIDERTAKDLMIKEPTTIQYSTTLSECMQIFLSAGIRHLVVKNGHKLAGIVSLEEISKIEYTLKETLIDQAIDGLREENQSLHPLTMMAFEPLLSLDPEYISPLQSKLKSTEIKSPEDEDLALVLRETDRALEKIKGKLEQFSKEYKVSQKVADKRLLLANSDKKRQLTAKVALASTGIQLDTVNDEEQAIDLIKEYDYDIVCVDSEWLNIAAIARDKNPNTKVLFLTSDHPSKYLPKLEKYPYIYNIVSIGKDDRSFFVKSLLTTVTKILSGDIFGIEKYLGWGVEVKQRQVTSSFQRAGLIEEMKDHLRNLGIKKPIIMKCRTAAEELLMNVVYDAPVDSKGNSLYNGMDRKMPVTLREHEYGAFRYGCDGVFVGISTQDPFGNLDRRTIFRYLSSCYEDPGSSILTEEKGGAGMGLFMIMELADLVIFNVKPGEKTEVTTLFTIDKMDSKK